MSIEIFKTKTAIKIKINQKKLLWPPDEHFPFLGWAVGNNKYFDLHSAKWADAQKMLDEDAAHLKQIEAASIPALAAKNLAEKLENDPNWSGLDIGLTGTVYTLAAFGCLPAASCNGGVLLERRHHETYPLIVFFLQQKHQIPIIKSARRTKVGLGNADKGALVLYASDLRNIHAFGYDLYKNNSPNI